MESGNNTFYRLRGGPGVRRAFTLIEILIVVVILGLLATIVVAQFGMVGDQADAAAIETALSRTRKQIEYYRMRQHAEPNLIANQWDDMVVTDYLQSAPVNMLNGYTAVDVAPGPNVGWVWRDNGHGYMTLYATDEDSLIEYLD